MTDSGTLVCPARRDELRLEPWRSEGRASVNSTQGFFTSKHEWSKMKDRILGAYLPPYLAKIGSMGRPVIIADCFAGRGRFADGEPGSPIIICEAIEERLRSAPANQIKAVFIEKKYVEQLRGSLGSRPYVKVLPGEYERRMEWFIKNYPAGDRNLLLYVDPYGIKSLRMSYLRDVSLMPFRTVEVLQNLNASGFLREACRLLKEHICDGDPLTENYEQDVNSPEMLDQIAGGNYWRRIVESYYACRDFQSAEDQFADAYCERLQQVFKYVIQIPVKVQMHHIAKYRMVYGTNSPDGLLLMADNMNKRWQEYRESKRPQDVLFEMDYPDRKMDPFSDARTESVLKTLDERTRRIKLKDLLVRLIEEYGVCFSTSQHTDALKKMEQQRAIVVCREPSVTPSGKPRRGWDHTGRNGYSVFIERGNLPWQPGLL